MSRQESTTEELPTPGSTIAGLARERTTLSRTRTALGAGALAAVMLHSGITDRHPLQVLAALAWCPVMLTLARPITLRRAARDRPYRSHRVASTAATIASLLTLASIIC